jgi:lysophospholipase L1-like esterase
MGYQPLVVAKCPQADVWGPDDNCRHSLWVLEHFEEWIASQAPDVVHVNFGIHDCVPSGDGNPQILLPQYRLSLKRVIARVKTLEKTQMIWATTTPLYIAEQDKPTAEWQILKEAGLKEYNDAALEIAESEGLPVNDLHEVIMSNDHTRCLSEDGCHMTEFGNEVLSDTVVKAIGALM